jgi:hypothetical protein
MDALLQQATQPIETASEKAGLTPIKDDGHILLKCSNCDKELIDIWLTHTEMPIKTKIAAVCCFCGDKSFQKEIKGVYHLSACKNLSINNIINDNEVFIIQTSQIGVKNGTY